MGRELRKVPMDFSWPVNKVWEGFRNPFYKYDHKCKECDGTGSSPRARELTDIWYGYTKFNPESTGSTPFAIDHPVIRRLAEVNTFHMQFTMHMDFADARECLRKNFGSAKLNELLVNVEAHRLCDRCFNNHWSHHLSQEDVDVLVENGRLTDLTHTWIQGKGWQPKDPPHHPTAKEVNEWSLSGVGHDSGNQWFCVRAKCLKEGVETSCEVCKGQGSIWESEELKQKAEHWERIQPPAGDGYQVWETVSEGSPISPVFEKPEDLANWMISNDKSTTKGTTFEQWMTFITRTQWAPSLISTSDGRVIQGVQA